MPPGPPDHDAARARSRDEPPLPPCLSFDLEVGEKDGGIHAVGAIRSDTRKSFEHYGARDMRRALLRLDELANGAEFVLGHNIIKHDLPILMKAAPNLRLLCLPALDTLRISPLAFPRNPYHRLVKHYKDGSLERTTLNDPLEDARLALQLFQEERQALSERDASLLTAWHWLSTNEPGPSARGMDRLCRHIRQRSGPSRRKAAEAIRLRLDHDGTCRVARDEVLGQVEDHGWPLAYALAWLSVAGGNSVMPPWVRHAFPKAAQLVRTLRDQGCTNRGCRWCRKHLDPGQQLRKWFKFKSFRPEPATGDGRSMQGAIVEAAMEGRHLLGILPTGVGKSVCYQLPALSRYERTGALTVVISPLVALMADQVTSLQKRGITGCVTVNSLLSLPERREVLNRIRLGDAGIVLIAPEQLRSPTVRRALAQREIGG